MYSKDMLIGILLTSKVDLLIERSSEHSMGYRIRLKLILRAEKDFLEGVKRSLAQHQITCSIKDRESKIRPKPILKIGGIKNLYKITELVPNLPDAKGEWGMLREVVDILNNNQHRTLEGFERILELKGVL